MQTCFSTDLVTISTTELVTVNGGDAAGDYGAALQKDWGDVQMRAQKTADALHQGNWGSAALNFGGTMVNEVKLASTALGPVKDLIGLGKK